MKRLDHPEVRRAQRRELWAELVAAGIVFAAMLVMASAMQSCAGHASAQLDEDDALILARLTVHESGWDSPADAVLIHQVLLGIVERDGVSYARAAELAAPRLARCAVARRWVCGLDAGAARPASWPLASWERHRPRWLAMLEHARAVVAGEVESPCVDAPRTWGSREDVLRGIRRGREWVDAQCRGTANVGGRWR